ESRVTLPMAKRKKMADASLDHAPSHAEPSERIQESKNMDETSSDTAEVKEMKEEVPVQADDESAQTAAHTPTDDASEDGDAADGGDFAGGAPSRKLSPVPTPAHEEDTALVAD